MPHVQFRKLLVNTESSQERVARAPKSAGP